MCCQFGIWLRRYLLAVSSHGPGFYQEANLHRLGLGCRYVTTETLDILGSLMHNMSISCGFILGTLCSGRLHKMFVRFASGAWQRLLHFCVMCFWSTNQRCVKPSKAMPQKYPRTSSWAVSTIQPSSGFTGQRNAASQRKTAQNIAGI